MPSRHQRMTKAQLIREIRKLEARCRQAGQDRLPNEFSDAAEEMRLQTEHLMETQRLLEESCDRYADLFDFAPLGYFMLDPNGVINDLNLTACNLLGVERSIAVKRPMLLFVAAEDRRVFLNHMLRCRRSQGVVVSELGLKTGSCDQLPVQLSSRPAHDSAEAASHYRTAITDLSERKRVEQKLRDRERELEYLNETLEQRVVQRTNEAHQRVAQLRRLASELTHVEQRERRRLAQILHDHLQQILVAAKIQVGLAKNMASKDVTRQAMAEADDLIKQSLDVSRWLTVELSPPVLFHADLATALEWVARRTHQKYGLRIEVDADHEVVPADDDVRTLIFEAVRELLFNVVKHAGAEVMASVILDRAEADYLRVRVEDTGAGFDATILEPAKSHAGQFGLFSIRERLELLGGRMEIESWPGQGTKVILLSPLKTSGVDARPQAAVVAGAVPLIPELPPHSARKIRVLLADDHKILREGLASILAKQCDMELVGQAEDGQAAVDLAHQLRPDVVVMNLSMPKLGGLETTRRITAELPDVRVIGLSMHKEEEVAAAMRQAGAVGYLTKGGRADQLVAAIRRCVLLNPAADRASSP